MFIEGVAIGGYRSFGDLQRIGPCQKVNLIVGPNNCGKSNVLSFLKESFNNVVRTIREGGGRQRFTFKETDRHIGDGEANFSFGLGASRMGEWFKQIAEKHPAQVGLVNQILDSQVLTKGTQLTWFEYESSGPGRPLQMPSHVFVLLKEKKTLEERQWQNIWTALCQKTGGDIVSHWIPETIRKLSPVACSYPDVSFVPAIRQISMEKVANENSDEHDLSGRGLIERLARLEKPDFNQQEDKDRFNKINHFLRTVTDNSSATLEIPYERDKIIVHMDGKSLPLTSLGTGIHEVIILASAATIVENQIVCMEEPELHLHPLLQRKLVKYLIDNTSNQYFISTHSAHILETVGAAVFHVQLVNGQTEVTPANGT